MRVTWQSAASNASSTPSKPASFWTTCWQNSSTMPGVTNAITTYTLAAAEFFYADLKGHLPLVYICLAGWNGKQQTR